MNRFTLYSLSAFFLLSAGFILAYGILSFETSPPTPIGMNDDNPVNINQAGLTLSSKGKSRQSVLDDIANQANIIIDYVNLSPEQLSQTIDSDITNATLEAALGIALSGIEFYSELSFDNNRRQHYTSRIFFKTKTESTFADSAANNRKDPIIDSPSKNHDSNDLQEDPRSLSASPEDRKLKRDIFPQLDTKSRLELLAEMSPTGADLQRIRAALLNDSDPNVRAAAAKRLAFSESYSATNSLLAALSDRNETVVAEAINSLVLLGDASVLPLMEEKILNPHGEVKISLAKAKEIFNRPIGMGSDSHK